MKLLKNGISLLLAAILLCSSGIIAFAEEHKHQYTATPVYATCTVMGATVIG